MKNKIIFFLTLICIYSSAQESYKVIYRANYISNLDTKALKTERTLLIIDSNKSSYYASENTYKQDSIKQLVRSKILTPQEAMNDKYPKTWFNHFIQKNFIESSMKVHSLIAVDNYIYTQKNDLAWQLQYDTLKVENYVCNKATVKYEGREYIAWYAKDIPISDGPYKFWGLPGLILKIYDTENHYTFTLDSFEKYRGKLPQEPYQSRKTFEVSYDKFKIISKEFNENPLKSMENSGMKIVSVDGKAPSQIPPPQRNPI